jgi:hypothetical protein
MFPSPAGIKKAVGFDMPTAYCSFVIADSIRAYPRQTAPPKNNTKKSICLADNLPSRKSPECTTDQT